MSETTNETPTRTGSVHLKVSYFPTRYETFPVRQWADGTTDYYLGRDLARTADGWVTLPADQLDRVAWDK
jgi:hypothetical protein